MWVLGCQGSESDCLARHLELSEQGIYTDFYTTQKDIDPNRERFT